MTQVQHAPDVAVEDPLPVRPAGPETRSVGFRADGVGDGRTLTGYAAVFNSTTRISGWEGEFDERIAPGAFAESIRERTPVLMFEHGQHPLLGSLPLGTIDTIREDRKGLYIEARLTDNWLIQPVRDAIAAGAVSGMSFRFEIPDGGDTWQERKGNVPLRTITRMGVAELGPVVFPAYEPTTAQVRSLMPIVERPVVAPAFSDSETPPAAGAEAGLASNDFTGQSDARSADGGDLADVEPDGSSEAADLQKAARLRHRRLRVEGIILE